MLAPITHPYPPPGYGPWERVAHDLTERLVADGHDVTLFASAGSETSATLVDTCPAPLEEFPEADRRRLEDDHISRAFAEANMSGIDLIHSHLHVHALRRAGDLRMPILTTLHGVAWDRSNHDELLHHRARPFVSLSHSERGFLPDLAYVATIPNGVDATELPVGDGTDGNLVFAGRIAPEKAPHLAVQVARVTGIPLSIAGPVEDRHRGYAESVLADGEGIADYLGPLDRPDLARLLGAARALVMPLQWDEPFGLVVIESLATGTPVVAWDRGAMRDIIEDGVTGYLVRGVFDAAAAVRRVPELSREDCVRSARSRFSDEAMARDYAGVYERLVFMSSRPGSTRAV